MSRETTTAHKSQGADTPHADSVAHNEDVRLLPRCRLRCGRAGRSGGRGKEHRPRNSSPLLYAPGCGAAIRPWSYEGFTHSVADSCGSARSSCWDVRLGG